MKTLIIFTLALCVAVATIAQGNSSRAPKPIEKTIALRTGITMHYAEQGNSNGTPVILIHGLTDSWHSYETVMPYLPAYLHVYALTMRGHGNSSKPDSNYHACDFAGDVAAFIREKSLGPSIIVGHSMGGVIAQQMALDFPSLTRALVIVDSDAAFSENPDLEAFISDVARLTDPVAYEFADAFQKSTLANPIDTLYYGKIVNETMKVPARVWKGVVGSLGESDFTKTGVGNYNKPVALFWGDKDYITPYKAQERLKKVFPLSKLNIYADTGHALHWERPKQFAKDLVAFIDSL